MDLHQGHEAELTLKHVIGYKYAMSNTVRLMIMKPI